MRPSAIGIELHHIAPEKIPSLLKGLIDDPQSYVGRRNSESNDTNIVSKTKAECLLKGTGSAGRVLIERPTDRNRSPQAVRFARLASRARGARGVRDVSEINRL